MDNNIQPKNTNLIEITTPVQAKRGNRQFFDTHHKVSYITYANGYVRREIKATYVSPYTNSKKVYKMQDQFVINRRTATKQTYKAPNGYEFTYTSTGVIKEPCPQKRMDIIDHHSTNYRGYKGRFTRSGYTLIAK
tara:strand:- start:80 stop:484 length:405 start_codon:yes stop_codon:yes gene_type:complete